MNEWIKISDSLPPFDKWVLTYRNDVMDTCQLRQSYSYSGSQKIYKNYWYNGYDDDGDDFAAFDYITHWMNLPEAPNDP